MLAAYLEAENSLVVPFAPGFRTISKKKVWIAINNEGQMHSGRRNERAHQGVERKCRPGAGSARFWEGIVEDFGCTVWNSEEETKWGINANNHSIIDLTLTTGGVEFNWFITGDEHQTGSDPVIKSWEWESGWRSKLPLTGA